MKFEPLRIAKSVSAGTTREEAIKLAVQLVRETQVSRALETSLPYPLKATVVIEAIAVKQDSRTVHLKQLWPCHIGVQWETKSSLRHG
jgi:hypothetical protein